MCGISYIMIQLLLFLLILFKKNYFKSWKLKHSPLEKNNKRLNEYRIRRLINEVTKFTWRKGSILCLGWLGAS